MTDNNLTVTTRDSDARALFACTVGFLFLLTFGGVLVPRLLQSKSTSTTASKTVSTDSNNFEPNYAPSPPHVKNEAAATETDHASSTTAPSSGSTITSEANVETSGSGTTQQPSSSNVEQPSLSKPPPTTPPPTQPPTTKSPPTTEAQAILVAPTEILASNTRDPVEQLKCGGSNSYWPRFLLDQDPQTGWGAAPGDGAGEAVLIDLGRRYRVTNLWLTPGYFRVAPRYSTGCDVADSAFTYNRFIEMVEYTFDDGSSVEQAFYREEQPQGIAVDVVTQTITLQILATTKWGEDNDTILSDIYIEGIPVD